MKSCNGLPGGTPAATGDANDYSWGMAIFQPSSKLFVTTGLGISGPKVFVCDQNNGVVSGCVYAVVPGLGRPLDIVFFEGSAIIADRYFGLITCKVSASGAGLENCANSNALGSAFGLLLV